MGRQGLARNVGLREKMWEQIEQVAGNLNLSAGKTRIYQDGLPVCGQEQQIVSELARAGSRNHQLLELLQSRGALLMGTESGELLLEEYREAIPDLHPGMLWQGHGPHGRHTRTHDTLLEKRDRYIADRINSTLGAGETGILFVGMLHDVTRYLPPDIKVFYPIHPQ